MYKNTTKAPSNIIRAAKSTSSTATATPVPSINPSQQFALYNSLFSSFDTRLRDLQSPYDARERTCLWPWHFDIAQRLPFVHEIFYKSFRVEGVGYLKAYFRLPQLLGGADSLTAVGRRAPSSRESQMYCGVNNAFLGVAFTGEVLLGGWMEFGYDWVLGGYDDVE